MGVQELAGNKDNKNSLQENKSENDELGWAVVGIELGRNKGYSMRWCQRHGEPSDPKETCNTRLRNFISVLKPVETFASALQ